jgi:predicted nucleic acid-binding protein
VTLVDTSIVVAAFASWDEHHAAADRLVDGKTRLVAHCALEAFSVLTRLPPPHRFAAHLVRDFLAARFPEPYVGIDAVDYRPLIPRLVKIGISGGAAYDALIAATARAADDLLVSCDRRAVQIYERVLGSSSA